MIHRNLGVGAAAVAVLAGGSAWATAAPVVSYSEILAQSVAGNSKGNVYQQLVEHKASDGATGLPQTFSYVGTDPDAPANTVSATAAFNANGSATFTATTASPTDTSAQSTMQLYFTATTDAPVSLPAFIRGVAGTDGLFLQVELYDYTIQSDLVYVRRFDAAGADLTGANTPMAALTAGHSYGYFGYTDSSTGSATQTSLSLLVGPDAVPEPAGLAVAAVAGLALRRRRRS